MAITFIGAASSPADNATNAASPVTIDPSGVGTMAVGDLVVVDVCKRTASLTYSVSNAGGQAWRQVANRTTTNLSSCKFWCRFNGTWSANPAFARSGADSTTPFEGVMRVYRGSFDVNTTWYVDVGETFTTYTSTGTTKTVTGQTTVSVSTVTVATWMSIGAITWGTLSGTGWVIAGGAQYRDTSGSGLSSTHAHKIQSAAGATGNVSQVESVATAGGDTIITFAEANGGASFVDSSHAGTTGNLSTASRTPTAGALQLLVIAQENLGGTSTIPTAPSTPTGCGITWSLLGSSLTAVDGSLFGHRLSVYTGTVSAPSAGSVTSTLGAQQVFSYIWYEILITSGVGLSASNTANTGASVSAALGTLTSGSSAFAFAGGGTSNLDPRTSWFELEEIGTAGSDCVIQAQWIPAGDTTASSATTFGGSDVVFVVGIEILAPVLFDPFGVSGMFGV